jgi:hypothetical protein
LFIIIGLLRGTARLRRNGNVYIEDDRGDLRIEAAFEGIVDNIVNGPGLQASQTFNLSVVKLQKNLKSKRLGARYSIVINYSKKRLAKGGKEETEMREIQVVYVWDLAPAPKLGNSAGQN